MLFFKSRLNDEYSSKEEEKSQFDLESIRFWKSFHCRFSLESAKFSAQRLSQLNFSLHLTIFSLKISMTAKDNSIQSPLLDSQGQNSSQETAEINEQQLQPPDYISSTIQDNPLSTIEEHSSVQSEDENGKVSPPQEEKNKTKTDRTCVLFFRSKFTMKTVKFNFQWTIWLNSKNSWINHDGSFRFFPMEN